MPGFRERLADLLAKLPSHRRSGVFVDLADFPLAGLADLLTGSVGDSDYFTRVAACHTLAIWGQRDAAMMEVLDGALGLRAEPELQVLAAAALARTGREDARQLLREVPAEGIWGLTIRAVDTLCLIGDEPTLAKMREDLNDPDVALIAAGALAKLGQRDAAPVLIEFLREGAEFEQVRALSCLAKVADEPIIALLREHAASPSPAVRRAACLTLARLAAPDSGPQHDLLMEAWGAVA